MKRALIIFGYAVVVLFLVVVGAAVYGLYWIDKPFRDARHFLLHDVDYRAVSVACLDMMPQPQYKPLMDSYPSGDDKRLPAAIRDVKAFWLSVNTDEIIIMKTGGFDHIGLVFHRSSTITNDYELVFREEGPGSDKLLYTLRLPKDVPSPAPEPTAK
jgi:hypothetical protein